MTFPTAFTPNGDGVNDEFKVVAKHLTNFRVMMFDRWGDMIFQSDDLEEGWNGTYNGRPMPIGTYVVHMSYRDLTGIPYRESGNVTLLR
jgi:gliding motility-associated-like protein